MNILNKILDNIYPRMHNCELTTYRLCKELKIKVTKSTILETVKEHPSYPSLLSIRDILTDLGVECLPISIKQNALINCQLDVPIIAQINVNKIEDFVLIKSISQTKIKYIHPIKKNVIEITHKKFKEIFTGVIMLVHSKNKIIEKDYQKLKIEENIFEFTKTSTILLLPIAYIIYLTILYLTYGTKSLTSILYSLITLSGTIVTTILIWYDIDKYNPVIQKFCTGGKKINCSEILESKASKIFGISWSTIGFTYFTGSILTLLLTNTYNNSNLFLMSWLNILALPYIVFSLFYQIKIVKYWCKLCLIILVIIFLQGLVSTWAGYQTAIIKVNFQLIKNILLLIFSYLITFLITLNVVKHIKNFKQLKNEKYDLDKLKNIQLIFNTLLIEQKKISLPSDGLGITLGNPNAVNKIIKICNPYCGPCSKAHPTIQNILKNNENIQIQIIFNIANQQDPIQRKTVQHLMAIAGKKDQELTKMALDDWYLAPNKDYLKFASKYPLKENPEIQDENIKAMQTWCNKEKIKSTPTYFMNGYQLPEPYNLSDLKYFLYN